MCSTGLRLAKVHYSRLRKVNDTYNNVIGKDGMEPEFKFETENEKSYGKKQKKLRKIFRKLSEISKHRT